MAGDPRTFRTHTVWTRQHWADAWTQQEDVYCDNLLWTCGPDFDRADLSYTYGSVKGFGDTQFATRTPLTLTDYYVKIIVTQTDGTTHRWYGVIVENERFQYGNGWNDSNPNLDKPESGKQKFTAVGLEYLLEREQYVTSWCEIYDSLFSAAFARRVQRGIAFNMGGGDERARRIVGNCTFSGPDGFPLFSQTIPNGEWTAVNIIEYLLYYHAPQDTTGADKLNWSLDIDAKTNTTLQSIVPKLDAHGMSVKQIIDHLCDRRRAISWKVVVDPILEHVGIEVFTFNSTNIPLFGGGTIVANTDTVEIDLAGDARVLSAPLVTSSTNFYDRVIARGAPVVLVLSLQSSPSSGQGTLVRDWTDANVTAYNAAASGDAGYAALDDTGKQGWNAAYRNSPAQERTFRYFKWDPERVKNELPPSGTVNIENEPMLIWPPGGRFLSALPLKFGYDYSTITTTYTTDKPADSVDEYLRPMAFVRDDGGTARFYRLHKLDWENVTDEMLRTWGGNLRMRHDQLGFAADVSGAPQHVLAADEFVPLAVDVTPFDGISPSNTGRLRWQYMVVTVALELDNFAESQWPWPDVDVGIGNDVVRTLYISVPDRRMEYVAPNTVFGLTTAGVLKKNTTGGWITDDSQKLQWVARIAYQWYATPRYAFDYSFRSLDLPYHVGQLVTNLITTGAQADPDKTKQEVNTVITSIAVDMRAGAYTLKTSFADFDSRGTVTL